MDIDAKDHDAIWSLVDEATEDIKSQITFPGRDAFDGVVWELRELQYQLEDAQIENEKLAAENERLDRQLIDCEANNE